METSKLASRSRPRVPVQAKSRVAKTPVIQNDLRVNSPASSTQRVRNREPVGGDDQAVSSPVILWDDTDKGAGS